MDFLLSDFEDVSLPTKDPDTEADIDPDCVIDPETEPVGEPLAEAEADRRRLEGSGGVALSGKTHTEYAVRRIAWYLTSMQGVRREYAISKQGIWREYVDRPESAIENNI